MGKQNASPEDSANAARRRAEAEARIETERRETQTRKEAHDAEVKRIREEGERRRAELLRAAIDERRRRDQG